MKNLELKNIGVQEMNIPEMRQVEGGGLLVGLLKDIHLNLTLPGITAKVSVASLGRLEDLEAREVAIAGSATVALIA